MTGYININSIRNKFEMLSNSIKGNLDILMICETKLGSTFPSNQFTTEGYVVPIRFDRNGRGESKESEVQEKNMPCDGTLNFDQWIHIPKTINQWEFDYGLWLVYKFTDSFCCLRFFSEFIQSQKRYPTSLGKIRILPWKLLVISS